MSKLKTSGSEPTIEGVDPPHSSYSSFEDRVEALASAIERTNVAEYVALVSNPRRMLWTNFLAGAARGLGMGVGFAVLTAVLLYILQGLVRAKLPFISDFIATIVRLTEQNLRP
ncbi:MAG TPA: DUF5665 domain-containing protein [Symbiobacteriaceae bacterium]|nr:DUF5665 domain-containing protein [Symbiobacteriaceae bacterium]